jgi:hypothetical protein
MPREQSHIPQHRTQRRLRIPVQKMAEYQAPSQGELPAADGG